MLVGQRRTREAVRLLQKTLEQAPEDVALRLALARTYLRDGQPDAARVEYRLVLELPDLDIGVRRAIETELAALEDAGTMGNE